MDTASLVRRYGLYARANALSPQEMLKKDSSIFPHSPMTCFRVWNRIQVDAWAKAKNTHPDWAVLYRNEVSDWIEDRLEEENACLNALSQFQ